MKWIDRAKVDLIDTRIHGRYMVRRYPNRIAVQSAHEEPISWEDLQKVKREILGDVVAVEIFPKESEVVNLRNTRHLWFGECLDNITTTFTHPEFHP